MSKARSGALWLCGVVVAASLVAGCGDNTPTPGPTTKSAGGTGAAASAPMDAAAQIDSDARNGITRTKSPEGGLLVSSPKVPRGRLAPFDLPDYTRGDWLVQNLTSEPAIITPFLEKDAYGSDVQGPILESLLSRDRDTFKWEPFLAESYEIKPDNVTLVFKLRKEAKFSDNHPVTADDVVFSFNTIMEKDVGEPRIKSYYARVESVTRLDERTVQFKFREPYFQALEIAGSMNIIPRHVYKHDTAAEYTRNTDLLVGSGPYLLRKGDWQRGQKITLMRNENYWADKPTFDRIVYVFIQNPQAAFQAFQNGEIDSQGANADQWEKFSKDAAFISKYTMYKYDRPNSGYSFIGWNQKKPLFADVKTRTALTMLIDRQTIIDTIQRKLAHPITGPFSFLTPQNDPTIKPLPFDPRGARKLLAEAGWKLNNDGILERNGVKFEFELTFGTGNPLTQQTAEFIKTQLGKAGIVMKITPYEFSVMVERLDDRKYDAAMLGWTGDIEGDPYQIWHSDTIKEKGSNFVSWSNPAADQLITAGRQEMDDAKRMEIWHKLHRIIADDQPYTFLFIRTATVFLQPRFKNTAPDKLGLNSGNWYVPKGLRKYQ